MAEYDAFGNRTGESPLEQRPAQAHPPVAPSPAGPGRPRASRTFPVVLGAAVLVVMASIGIAVSLLTGSSAGEGALDVVAVEDAPPEAPQATQPGGTPPAPGAQPGQAPVPSVQPGGTAPGPGAEPASGSSLFERPVLARAIRAMRVAELGRPISFRVTADRIDAQLISSRGLLHTVRVGVAGEPRELSATQATPIPSMPWSAVDPAAPQRLVRAATEREKRPAADVDYLVLLDLGKPTWGLFFRGGTHYQGDAAGKLLRRVS